MKIFLKKFHAGLVVAGLIFGSSYTYADQDIRIGIDGMYSYVPLKQQYGKNAFSRNLISYNFFADYYFNKHIFAELGYETSQTKKHTSRISAGDYIPGSKLALTSGQYSVYNTRMQIQHPYLALGYDLAPFNNLPNTHFQISAGASITKVKAQLEETGNETNPTFTQAQIDQSRRKFAKTKAIPMIRFGISQHFYEHVGIRLTATWRNLSAFKIKNQEYSLPNKGEQIRFKDTTTVGLGIFYKF